MSADDWMHGGCPKCGGDVRIDGLYTYELTIEGDITIPFIHGSCNKCGMGFGTDKGKQFMTEEERNKWFEKRKSERAKKK